jgi:hypothetical protein
MFTSSLHVSLSLAVSHVSHYSVCMCVHTHHYMLYLTHSAALIAVGSALSALTLGGVSVSHLDIAPKRAGLVFGAGKSVLTTIQYTVCTLYYKHALLFYACCTCDCAVLCMSVAS